MHRNARYLMAIEDQYAFYLNGKEAICNIVNTQEGN